MPQAKDFYITRLDPNNASTWCLWPVFEERVKNFMRNISHESEEAIISHIVKARNRWTAAPLLTLYMLIFDNDHRSFSHVVGEVSKHDDNSYLEILQYEVDKGHNALFENVTAAVIAEIESWAKALNLAFPKNNKKFTSFELTTERNPDAYVEYFKRLNRLAKKVKTVIECQLDIST